MKLKYLTILFLFFMMGAGSTSSFINVPNETAVAYKGFAFVELFTSEGCSSCPPADELVSRILKESKDKPVYILCYHVDYWDRLGWKDVFSSHDFSLRQYRYSKILHEKSAYTPQIVVNGETGFVGSNEPALRRAILTELDKPSAAELLLSDLAVKGGKLSVNYALKKDSKAWIFSFALVQSSGGSNVISGENKGRKLAHVNIVRSLQTIQEPRYSGNYSVELPKEIGTNHWQLIGFLQDLETGKILAAQKIE